MSNKGGHCGFYSDQLSCSMPLFCFSPYHARVRFALSLSRSPLACPHFMQIFYFIAAVSGCVVVWAFLRFQRRALVISIALFILLFFFFNSWTMTRFCRAHHTLDYLHLLKKGEYSNLACACECVYTEVGHDLHGSKLSLSYPYHHPSVYRSISTWIAPHTQRECSLALQLVHCQHALLGVCFVVLFLHRSRQQTPTGRDLDQLHEITALE